ncbi:MAG: thioredoxin family protein [Verrucomicrobia bacterium]|jgi:thioredoxin 1|nr:thioredoxin family protein [Verrucomicrobiota bacterium]
MIVVLLICATGVVLVAKSRKPETGATASFLPSGGLPHLVDFGSGTCRPCKMMAPILEELKRAHAGTFEVTFIDIRKTPDAREQYGIRLVPTQIFYDAAGKELFRHEGFFSEEEILATWKKHGVAVSTER